MSKKNKSFLKFVLGMLYLSISSINLLGLKYGAWTCTEKSINYQIWLTVSVILAYSVICAIYKSFKLWERLERCKVNMRKTNIK